MIQLRNPLYIPLSFALFCLLVLVLKSAGIGDGGDNLVNYCSEYDHYNEGSEFQNNLIALSLNLTSRANTTSFSKFTTGESPNEIYGLYLCYPSSETNQSSCHDCVSKAVQEIQQNCQFSKEYIVWYLGCMFRYANRPIFSAIDVSLYYNLVYAPTIYSNFNPTLSSTFTSLFENITAANLSSSVMTVEVTTGLKLLCSADCTPDLSPSYCMKCLMSARRKLLLIGTRVELVLQPSCILAYAFNDTRPSKSGERHIALGVISAIAGASFVFNLVFVLKRRTKSAVKPTGLDEIESMENLHFEFEAIRAATENFSPAYKLGRGGFGVVYMGTLPDGKAVAVKRLSNASGQGIREFKTEASLAAKVQHKNLVKVYGFCLEGDEKLLVYEFVPNKSLDRFLFDEKRGAYLKWETRYKIIVGIARGLLYLHEDSCPKIIHRDLKPSNVLLDGEMNPKISDFGMAKLFGTDQSEGNTSRVAGTFGYMAPEYVSRGHFSVKSDIFSYGVILLELVSGLRNNSLNPDGDSYEGLLNYAWRLWTDRNHLELVDSALGTNFSKLEVERCIHVALLCTQEDPARRPNIASVLTMLNTQPIIDLPSPTFPPAFPYKQEKIVDSHGSCGIQAEEDISDLSAR